MGHETLFPGFAGADSAGASSPAGRARGDCAAVCGQPFVNHVRGAPAVATAAQKKALYATERNTPRISRLRQASRRRMTRVARRRLKFLDETGLTIRLTPLYGRTAPGERVVDKVPRNYGQSLSPLAMLSPHGMRVPMTVVGAGGCDSLSDLCRVGLRPCPDSGRHRGDG